MLVIEAIRLGHRRSCNHGRSTRPHRGGTPLRQRMLDDMRMRKLEPKTQEAYIRAVRKLAAHLKRSPETATVEDLRNFQLHLVDTGTSPITLNATLTGLKFFFDVTLGRIGAPATLAAVRCARDSAMLAIEAIRLVHRQEQRPWTSHPTRSRRLAAAPTHARRHAHAQVAPSTRRKATSAPCASWPPSSAARPTPPPPRTCAASSCTWSTPAPRPITLNATLTGLKFFFDITLGRPELMAKMQHVTRAAHAAGGPEPRGSRPPDRRGAQPQAPGGPVGGLRRGPARQRGRRAQGRRHRQPAHDAARGAGQGPQGSLRHAQPGAAGAAARLVARRPRPGQDPARRLAVPGPGSDRPR